jgi:ABC-2 type transport system permease protein
MFQKFNEFRFLFEELTKRDFRKKYKRTTLGMMWSILNPLFTLLIMRVVFMQFFGATIPHYTTYLFAGTLVYSYFTEATNSGMYALISNKDIFSKVNLPKYMFVLSANSSAFINFMLTVCIFLVFAVVDGIALTWGFFLLLFPIVLLLAFNIGASMILSAVYLFFQDTKYLYGIFTMLLMYLSAIFYQVESFPIAYQRLFLMNPVYVYIKFFRVIVIDGHMPSIEFFLLSVLYALAVNLLGAVIYRKYNNRFLYYV